MNTVALTKALRFACLPTLSLLILLFFAFFDFGRTLEFISSTEPLAVVLRIVAFGGEVILVYFMYTKYLREEAIKGGGKVNSERYIRDSSYIRDIKVSWGSNDSYSVQDTEDSNVVLIIRKPY